MIYYSLMNFNFSRRALSIGTPIEPNRFWSKIKWVEESLKRVDKPGGQKCG
jgi:hypothetical protein